VSRDEVKRQFAERRATFGDGAKGLREFLASEHKRAGDVELEIETELAAAKLRAMLERKAKPVSRAQVYSYYRDHMAQFGHGEMRYLRIVEGLPTRRAALRAMQGFKRGHKVGRVLHESLERPLLPTVSGDKRVLGEAILAAKVGVVTGPISFNEVYAFFEVTRVKPPSAKPLSVVRPTIVASLQRQSTSKPFTGFLGAWRAKWVARTSCAPGFVAQQCRQYRGPVIPEGSPFPVE
jgi:foldase protein PrsA